MVAVFGLFAIVYVCNLNCAEPEGPGFQLIAKPSRCVALHEGQKCYLNLAFRWQSKEVGRYCLYEENKVEALACWNNATKGEHHLDFESRNSVQYRLRNESNHARYTEVSVTVSWVYNSNTRKTNWRLF
jgi:hypothetical protein